MSSKEEKLTDEEPLTPLHSSISYPVWQKAALELASALEKLSELVPDHLLDEVLIRHQKALEFLSLFKSWSPKNPPSDTVRRDTIQAMLDFNSETRDFITQCNVGRRVFLSSAGST
jgi:hypothetical protein